MLASDGRLYRCDVTPTLSNGALAADDGGSDEDWEEREASRTHSVKFTDPQDHDSREVSPLPSKCPLWPWLRNCVSRNLWPSDSYYMLNSVPSSGD